MDPLLFLEFQVFGVFVPRAAMEPEERIVGIYINLTALLLVRIIKISLGCTRIM